MKRNKKGELLTLSIIVILVLLGALLYIQGTYQKENFYIGEIYTGTVYNPNSKNPDCLIENISIDTNNIKLFKSLDQATQEGYTPHEFCN